jgi:predicted nuclease of predicted toxin-antitoxin system
MRAFLDQGLPYSTVRHLRAAGWDVIHAVDVEMERATDSAIVNYARVEKRFCVTLDSDFHSIVAIANESSPSVIRIRQEGLSGQKMAELLIHIYPEIEADIATGAFVTVTDKNIRVRCLPV